MVGGQLILSYEHSPTTKLLRVQGPGSIEYICLKIYLNYAETGVLRTPPILTDHRLVSVKLSCSEARLLDKEDGH